MNYLHKSDKKRNKNKTRREKMDERKYNVCWQKKEEVKQEA